MISSDQYYGEIINNLKKLNDEYDIYKDKIVSYSAFKEELFGDELRKWDNVKNIMPYRACKVDEDIVYLSLSEDCFLLDNMFMSGQSFSGDLIEAFFILTQKYFTGKLENKGYFLDIGANIGTTSVYVKKKVCNNLSVIGFEPDKLNYDIFRVNCILNQVEDIKAELCGLSNTNGKKKLKRVKSNLGGSIIVNDNEEGKDINTITTRRLDDYLKEENIMSDDIDYIWIDAEGHECEIIEGAIETLKMKKIPLLQEFNPVIYYGKNMLESFCANISKVYDNFIDANEYMAGNGKVMSTDILYSFGLRMKENKKKQTDLFFF